MNSKQTHRLEKVSLTSPVTGTSTDVRFHHYGNPDSRPKAYLHAALHADETPGLLVMHKLLQMFDQADAGGDISGHIVAAPFANPIGLSQFLFGRQQGRFYSANGKNFNREYPDISEEVADLVSEQMTQNADDNVGLIRAACQQVMENKTPQSAIDILKHALFSRSVDADFVLDLHCDHEAVLYMFALPESRDKAAELSAYLGCQVTLLAEPSPVSCFDDANGALWRRLAAKFPDHPIPSACMSTTIELRGDRDVDEQVAERDARGIFSFLQANGVIRGEISAQPASLCEPTPFDGVGQVLAPHAGVVSFCRNPGDHVEKGEQVASVFSLDKDSEPTALSAPTGGLVYSRISQRYVFTGYRGLRDCGPRAA